MSGLTPTDDISPSASRRFFPKSLRKKDAKARPSSKSSRAASINEGGSSASHSLPRSSLESISAGVGSSRPRRTSDPPPASGLPASSTDAGKLRSLLSKAKIGRRKSSAVADDELPAPERSRGRTSTGPASAEANGSLPLNRSYSDGSKASQGSRRSEASRITTDSSDGSLVSPPPLVSHPSHAGYLTHSSPLIQKSSPGPAVLDPSTDGLGRINSLPPSSPPVIPTIELPTPSPPQHAATFQAPPALRPRSRLGPAGDRKSSTSTSLKGLFGRKSDDPAAAGKRESLRSRRPSKVNDSAANSPPPIQTSSLSKVAAVSADSPTPETTVTPPTPTVPAADATFAELPSPTEADAVVDATSSSSGRLITNRRARSNSASNNPSNLSNVTAAPLTPTLEESKSGANTPAPSDRPASQGGFFSSVFSAAQSAATTLGNSISSNTLSIGVRSRDSTGAVEKAVDEKVPSTTPSDEPAIDSGRAPASAENKRVLAVETLGAGELSFSHLGLSSEPPTDRVGSANGSGPGMATAAVAPAPTPTEPVPLSSGRTDQLRDNGSIHTVSSAGQTHDDGQKKASNASAKASGSSLARATPDEPLSAVSSRPMHDPHPFGDRTPPTTRDSDREPIFRRSGSVRSRTDASLGRQRGGSNATGATIAAAIGASHSALAAPGRKAVGPRLTGFAIASKKRNRDFHSTFRSVPEDDYLIEDYSAALQKDILLHGRFYVSESHICFNSNIFGYVTTLIISFDEVVSIEKKNTAMIIPNGLAIQTLHARHVFASFTSRDTTYDLLISIWKISHPNLRSSLNGVELDEAGGGDKTVKPEGASDDDSDDGFDDDEDEFYDEDRDGDLASGSLSDGPDASPAGSDPGDAATRAGTRKASAAAAAAPATVGGSANGTAAEALTGDGEAAAGRGADPDFPGPASHGPTSCADQEAHFEKVIKDDVIPAPLGKVYNLMFGPASGGFMSRWLVEDQKVTELQFDDRVGIGDGKKSRSYSYIKPLSGAIGPRQTKCLITETVEAFNLDKAVSVLITTQTPDVPSGNAFSVKTRYCLTWAEASQTRLVMNCSIEWTSKSWLKSAIEKGANDGQTSFANSVVAAIKAAVARSRGAAATAATKGGKARRRKKEASEATLESVGPAGGGAPAPAAGQAGEVVAFWGLLAVWRTVSEAVFALVRPWLNATALLIIVVGVDLLAHFPPEAAAPEAAVDEAQTPRRRRGRSLAALSTPERRAAYEELWRQEESELWDWLDERVDMMRSLASSQSAAVPRRGGEGEARRSEEAAGSDSTAAPGVVGGPPSPMSRRDMEEALYLTRDRLDDFAAFLDRTAPEWAKRETEEARGGGRRLGKRERVRAFFRRRW